MRTFSAKLKMRLTRRRGEEEAMGDLREDRIYKILQSYWHVEENGDKAGNIHININTHIYIMLIILKHFLRYKKAFDILLK